ncbi:hypothetical protein BIW11_04618 [Tropilaelaps mercedesae]|uniref:Uncharacterized protein n=1 Tax=Tropilaelaps mercedesae TaxID=418985 RepID=A0A1V9X3D0_9ACAR|nr:hypothetical protein BIW11_04618 [Tropilaelaps mercedesae]
MSLPVRPLSSGGEDLPTSSADINSSGGSSGQTEKNLYTAGKLELMELENIVANTVYLKAREGEAPREPTLLCC